MLTTTLYQCPTELSRMVTQILRSSGNLRPFSWKLRMVVTNQDQSSSEMSRVVRRILINRKPPADVLEFRNYPSPILHGNRPSTSSPIHPKPASVSLKRFWYNCSSDKLPEEHGIFFVVTTSFGASLTLFDTFCRPRHLFTVWWWMSCRGEALVGSLSPRLPPPAESCPLWSTDSSGALHKPIFVEASSRVLSLTHMVSGESDWLGDSFFRRRARFLTHSRFFLLADFSVYLAVVTNKSWPMVSGYIISAFKISITNMCRIWKCSNWTAVGLGK